MKIGPVNSKTQTTNFVLIDLLKKKIIKTVISASKSILKIKTYFQSAHCRFIDRLDIILV